MHCIGRGEGVWLPLMSIGLGIVGAGTVARLHAGAAVKAGMRLVGICDVDAPRAETLAAEHPGAMATATLDELLTRNDIAAVVVAVPNVHHKQVTLAALRAGKDVLLEKPMAMNTAECDEIIEVAAQTDRIVQMGFVCRCAPAAAAARDIVTAGTIGRIYHAKASLYRRRGIPGLGRWFTTKSQSGGGALMDVGVHLIDLVLHLTEFPTPTRASAVCTSTFGDPIGGYGFEEMWGGPPDPDGVFDVEDAATALVRFGDGMSMELNVTWAVDLPEAALRDAVVLLGDRGGCVVDIWNNELIVTGHQGNRLVDAQSDLPGDNAWDSAWQTQHERFRRCVSERSAPAASAREGRAVQTLIDALYRSAGQGQEVAVESVG